MQHILSLVRRCVEDYHMIQAGETVAVGISGGKDSVLTLCALARLREFYPQPFDVVAITIDSGTPGMDFTPIAALCRELNVSPTTGRRCPSTRSSLNTGRRRTPAPSAPSSAGGP